MKSSFELGRAGEEEAVKWLESNGHKVIFRNFRRRGFEIDIIAIAHDEVLRFIEVKKVDKGSLSDAAFSIENRNILNYIKGVDVFISEHPSYSSHQISMDAIIISPGEVQYYRNISGELAF